MRKRLSKNKTIKNIWDKAVIMTIMMSMVVSTPIATKVTETQVKAETISKETEWNIKCLNAENSYNESKNLPKIKVAILDSGLDYDPDLPAVEKKDFFEEEELHPLYQDPTGHGTSVASIICARENEDRITGIAANVDLYIARILDEENQAPIERVIDAVHWAMEEKVNIIHMSFGTTEYSEAFEDAIEEAYRAGILIIAAAGNNGKAAEDESTIEYPAAFDHVISVGATNKMNAMTGFSASGEELDVVAPGSQILTDGAFGGVAVEEGTSISAAHVTGVAAVLWGKHPEKTNEFIKSLLVGSANKEAVKDETCGNGLVDYEEADKNYEQMNQVYTENKEEGKSEEKAVAKAERVLPENTKKVATHKEVNYVNATWHKEQHRNAAEKYDSDLTSDAISIVKAGAFLPDKVGKKKLPSGKIVNEKYSWRGRANNPFFHGEYNYLAHTHYLICMARNYISGSNKLPDNQDLALSGAKITTSTCKELIKRLKKKNVLSKFFEKCAKVAKVKGSFDKEKQGYALLGAAIHNITDAFSHSAYGQTSPEYGGKWIRVVHMNASTDTLWKKYSKISSDDLKLYGFTKADRDYFEYMSKDFAIADTVTTDKNKNDGKPKLDEMYNLACMAAESVINGLKEQKTSEMTTLPAWLIDFRDDIQNATINDSKWKVKYKLCNLNQYWKILTGEEGNFGDFSIFVKNILKKQKLKVEAPEFELKINVNGLKTFLQIRYKDEKKVLKKMKKLNYSNILFKNKKLLNIKQTISTTIIMKFHWKKKKTVISILKRYIRLQIRKQR